MTKVDRLPFAGLAPNRTAARSCISGSVLTTRLARRLRFTRARLGICEAVIRSVRHAPRASSSVAGLLNQFLQQTVNLVKLCLDLRGVLQLGLEVLPDLNEPVINDGEDFFTLNLRSCWSCRSRSSSRTSFAA